MVTVAKGIDAPIKLLAPKPGSSADFAMLGLGDVVIPGLVIALCLRFDLYRHVKRNPTKDITRYSSFSRPYFWTGILSYIVGLATTMGVMHCFKAAQPALLYLSPACSELFLIYSNLRRHGGDAETVAIGPLLLALIRGELPLLWSYKEGADAAEAKKDDTIEAPSETAMAARKARQETAAQQVSSMEEDEKKE